jgi:methyl-accepting chemotaxis protein
MGRRIVLSVAAGATVILLAAAIGASRFLERSIWSDSDRSLTQAAEQAALVIDHVLTDRQRQALLLASLPTVNDAARAGTDRARSLGLDKLSTDDLERRYATTRTLDADERTRRFLSERIGSLDIAEAFLTDVHGFNAVTTERTSDFVQSDEAWWQAAMRDTSIHATADYDESARQVSIAIAAPLREHAGSPAGGVIKLVYNLVPIHDALTHAAALDAVDVELLDESGRLVASSTAGGAPLRPFPGALTLRGAAANAVARFESGASPQRAAVRAVNGGAWRVVSHVSEAATIARLRRMQLWLAIAGIAVLLALVAAVTLANRYLRDRIEAPAGALATVAEAVAGGDLSMRFTAPTVDDEIGRVGRAVSGMISALHRVVDGIRAASDETAAMALEINTGTEQMSAAAHQMAETSGDLSTRSSDMAQMIHEMAADAARLSGISDSLAAGAHEGVDRNRTLRTLAAENGDRLDESAHQLDTLADDVRRSAESVEALARASDEIGAFVTFVQKIARQSKLLALNASVEASRAGSEGEGFAVVADEVRRLAATVAEAAGRTDALVADVLLQIKEARGSASRSADTLERVRRATRGGLAAFARVEEALGQTEPWMASIVEAAATANGLAGDTTRRLDALAKGTEAFVAAMEEVASGAVEQSASTHEIAAAAGALAVSAARLRQLAASFKVGSTEEVDDTDGAASGLGDASSMDPRTVTKPSVAAGRGRRAATRKSAA